MYRSWMPQTAASTEERIRSLKKLRDAYPSVCWKICIEEFSAGPFMGFESYRPRWRSDASGSGQPLTSWEEINLFRSEALRLALDWPEFDGEKLTDLVEKINEMPDDEQPRVWELINSWADSDADEVAKAKLAESIRNSVLKRRGTRYGLTGSMRERVDTVCRKLESTDPVVQNAWLFASSFIEMSADELDDEDIDAAYERHHQRTDRLRAEAMGEIWEERGLNGIVALLSGGCFEFLAGKYLAVNVVDVHERAQVLRQCLSVKGDIGRSMDFFVRGFLEKTGMDVRAQVIADVVMGIELEEVVRVFLCAPFHSDTWRLLKEYGEDTVSGYWHDVEPHANRYSEAETTEIIDRFLEAKRPRAAFKSVNSVWTRVETSRLKRLLLAVATVDEEPEGEYQINPYYISKSVGCAQCPSKCDDEGNGAVRIPVRFPSRSQGVSGQES